MQPCSLCKISETCQAIPFVHVLPLYPLGQTQIKFSRSGRHIPLFWHGDEKQGLRTELKIEQSAIRIGTCTDFFDNWRTIKHIEHTSTKFVWRYSFLSREICTWTGFLFFFDWRTVQHLYEIYIMYNKCLVTCYRNFLREMKRHIAFERTMF